MHCVHSKTAYYNSFLAEIWDECFVKTFGLVINFTSSSRCTTLRICLMLKLRGMHFNGYYYRINRYKYINTLIISVLAGPME
jgi:hypothetical protein